MLYSSLLSISATEASCDYVLPKAANPLANLSERNVKKEKERKRRRRDNDVIRGIIEDTFKQLGLFLPA
jgi:hypothetical protein